MYICAYCTYLKFTHEYQSHLKTFRVLQDLCTYGNHRIFRLESFTACNAGTLIMMCDYCRSWMLKFAEDFKYNLSLKNKVSKLRLVIEQEGEKEMLSMVDLDQWCVLCL